MTEEENNTSFAGPEYPWERRPKRSDQKGESPQAYEAFSIYRDLGPQKRTLSTVATQLSKSLPLIKRWSSRHEWVDRVAAYDAYIDRKKLAKDEEALLTFYRQRTTAGRLFKSKMTSELIGVPDPEHPNPEDPDHWKIPPAVLTNQQKIILLQIGAAWEKDGITKGRGELMSVEHKGQVTHRTEMSIEQWEMFFSNAQDDLDKRQKAGEQLFKSSGKTSFLGDSDSLPEDEDKGEEEPVVPEAPT